MNGYVVVFTIQLPLDPDEIHVRESDGLDRFSMYLDRNGRLELFGRNIVLILQFQFLQV